MEGGGRSFGGERAREMAIGAGGDVSADNSSVALPPSARRADPFSASPSAHARNWRFCCALPSFLLLSWGNRKILFLAFPPILSQWLWAGREENTPVCVRRARQNRQTNPKQRESKTKIAPAAHLKHA